MLRKNARCVSLVVLWAASWTLVATSVAGPPQLGSSVEPVSVSAASPAANQLFAQGARLLKQEKYALAAERFWLFLERYPRDPLADHARHYIGVAALRRGELPEAASLFAQVVSATKVAEVKQQSLAYFGWCLLSMGSDEKQALWEQAATIFQAHRDQFPDSPTGDESLFLQGECLSRLRRWDEARQLYQQLIAEYPQSARHADAMFALAAVERQLGDEPAADDRLQVVANTYPDDQRTASIHLAAAERAFAHEEYSTAAELYRKVLVAAPRHGADVALVKLAACLAQLGQHAQAAELYRRVPNEHPQSEHAGAAWLAAGHHFLKAGMPEQAKPCLQVVVDRDWPGADKARHWLVRCELATGERSRALDTADDALDTNVPGVVRQGLLLDRADALAAADNRRSDAFVAYLQAFQAARLPELAQRALQGMLQMAQTESEFASLVEVAGLAAQTRPQPEVVLAAQQALAAAQMSLGQYREAARVYQQLLKQQTAHHPLASEWTVNAAWALLLDGQYNRALQTLETQSQPAQRVSLRAEAELVRGFALLKLQRPAEAVEPLERVVLLDPDTPNSADAREALVRCYRLGQRWDDASRQVEMVLEREPGRMDSPPLQLDLAEIAYHHQDLATAEQHYQQALQHDPDTETLVTSLSRLARLNLQRGQPTHTILYCDRLIDEQPEHPLARTARLERAHALQQIDRHDEAVTDLWDFLEDQSNSAKLQATAVFALGVSYVHLEQPADALSAFRTVVQQYPKFARADEALYQTAALAHQLQRHDAAVAAFRRVTEEFPDSDWAAAAEYHLGQLSYDRQRDATAIAHFESAIQLGLDKPLLAKAYYRLGWACYRSGDLASACQAFDNQRRLGVHDAFAHDGLFMLAESLSAAARWQAAAEVYEQIVDHAETNRGMQIVALLHGGQAMLEVGRLDVAVDWLERLTDDSEAEQFRAKSHWLLGRCRQQQQQLAAAERHLVWAATHGDGDVMAQARFDLGQLLVAQDRWAEALQQFAGLLDGAVKPTQRVQGLQPRGAYWAAHCARTLAAEAEDAEERARYQREADGFQQQLIERFPASPEAAEARAGAVRLTAAARD